MKTITSQQKIGLGIVLVAIVVVVALVGLPAKQSAQLPGSTKLIAQNAILAGLPAGALFPFIDSTPNSIASAHIALTDSTSDCSPGAASPSNLVISGG